MRLKNSFSEEKKSSAVLGKIYLSKFPDKLSKKYKILLKTLNGAQNFLGMIGYVPKDFGRAHYSLVPHNIELTLLSRGREAHDSIKENVLNDKSKGYYANKCIQRKLQIH